MINTSYKNSLGVSLLYAREQKIYIHDFSLPSLGLLEIIIIGLSRSVAHRLPPLDPRLKRFLLVLDVALKQPPILIHFLIRFLDDLADLLFSANDGMHLTPLHALPLQRHVAALPHQGRLDRGLREEALHPPLVDLVLLAADRFVVFDCLLSKGFVTV